MAARETNQYIHDLGAKIRFLRDELFRAGSIKSNSITEFSDYVRIPASTIKSCILRERVSPTIQAILAKSTGFDSLWVEWRDPAAGEKYRSKSEFRKDNLQKFVLRYREAHKNLEASMVSLKSMVPVGSGIDHIVSFNLSAGGTYTLSEPIPISLELDVSAFRVGRNIEGSFSTFMIHIEFPAASMMEATNRSGSEQIIHRGNLQIRARGTPHHPMWEIRVTDHDLSGQGYMTIEPLFLLEGAKAGDRFTAHLLVSMSDLAVGESLNEEERDVSADHISLNKRKIIESLLSASLSKGIERSGYLRIGSQDVAIVEKAH